MGHAELGIGLNSTTSGMRRLVVLPTQEMRYRQRIMGNIGQSVDRTDPQRALGPFHGAFCIPGVGLHGAAQEKGESRRRAQYLRALKRFQGRRTIMLHHPDDVCPKRQRHRVITTVGDRSSGMANGSDAVVLLKSSPHKKNLMTPRE